MLKLTQRQQAILGFIRKSSGGSSNKDIVARLKEAAVEKSARATVVRDLDFLLRNKLIKKNGQGRSVAYLTADKNQALAFFDPEKYFSKEPDEREVENKNFNFKIFSYFPGFFSEAEADELSAINKQYRQRVKKLPAGILKKEIERLTIELSWKSSRIEGNTYSLLDTEILIKDHKEAAGHKKDEAMMILNHKTALDYIFSAKGKFKKINLRQIEEIHAFLIKGMNVGRGLRKNIVGITGTVYRPLDNQYQIREAMEKMIKIINRANNPLEKSLIALLLIPCIQPFEDGNKRTSRLIANALLLASDFCPLSFRSINESDYKKAVILFYEQNSALFFKELFVKQFKFAVRNYFL